MHILTFCLLFVIGSIQAATHGDYSGIEAIGKFILFIVLFLVCGWLLTNPVGLLIAVIVFIIAMVCICSK